MVSLTRFSVATPTTPPLGLYTPLSAGGLTGLDPTRPGLLTAVGRILHRILSLTTTASTSGFKWLSLGKFSHRHLNLQPTPTSAYLEPTLTTFLATGNFSLAIIAIPPLILFFSLLFGAGMALSRRGRSSSSPFTAYRQQKAKNERLSPKSLYSESPTLFHQDDTVSPPRSYMPCLSSFWISALKFGLRGLAFLFRLICVEKLLDMAEDYSTEQRAVTSADSCIAELRALNRKLGQATNVTTPTQTVVSLARLPDANKTLVAPFSVHAKSKSGQGVLPPSEYDKVILLPEDVKAHPRPPLSVEINPASTHKASVTPPVEDVFGVIADSLGLVHAGASSVPSFAGGENSLPTSYRRSSSRIRRPASSPDTVLAPVSVQPDIPSPVYKSLDMPFRPIRLTTGDRPSTPPRHNEAISPSVEPSGVPGRFMTALESHAESSAQAEVRRTRCLEDSPQRPRYSKASTPPIDVAPKSTPASAYQIAVRQLFQHCFDDMSSNSKPATLTSSVRPLDPTLELGNGHRASVSVQEECPKTPPRQDVTASPEDFLVQSREGLAPTGGTEEIPPQPLNNTSRKDRSGTEAIKLTREILLSGRSSTVAEANRSRFESVEGIRENARKILKRAREAATDFDLHTRPAQFSAAGTENLESVQTVRENARRSIQRSQEAAAALDIRIRTKYPGRESQAGKQPQRPTLKSTDSKVCEETVDAMEQIRLRHDELIARVHATLRHHDEKRELRAQSMSSRSQAVNNTKNVPGLERPSTLPSKQAPTTTQSGSSRELPHSSRNLTPIKPRESQEVATITQISPHKRSCSTLPSEPRSLTMPASDSLLELNVPGPVSDTSCVEDQGENAGAMAWASWSFEGVPRGISAADQADETPSPVESSWRIEDHIPQATDDETDYEEDSMNDGDVESVGSSRTQAIISGPSRSHAPPQAQDQPQKIQDLFYSPTPTPSTHPAPNTNFLNSEKFTGFGFGSPCGRQIQRLDPRDMFSTSTPRVNYAHLGRFSTSTPRRNVDHRRDTWADFF